MNKNTLITIMIALGALAGLYAARGRWHVEAQNRAVEICVDYTDALQLSLAAHKPFPETLRALHRAGVSSLAIAEDPMDAIRLMGAMSEVAISPTDTVLTFEPEFPGQEQRVIDALTHKTKLSFQVTGDAIAVRAPYYQFSGVGVGLNPVEVNNALAAGFYICPRVYNYPGVSRAAIDWMLQQLVQQCTDPKTGKPKATEVIFSGFDVLGSRGKINDTAAALAMTGLHYGSIEFGKQVGDDDLSRAAINSLVRVHSIGGNEMPLMDEPTAVGRFILGARERNIRVCYVRLFLNGLAGQPDVMAANTEFLKEVVDGLEEGGITITGAHPYRDEPLPTGKWTQRGILFLLALGTVGASMLLLRQIFGLDGRPFWILLAIGLLASMYLLKHGLIGRQLLALASACAFPSIGLIAINLPRAATAAMAPMAALRAALGRFCLASMWTFLGILMVVGLLAARIFMLHVEQFMGIRLAIVMPMVITLVYYGLGLAELNPEATWAERKRVIAERYAEFARSPLKIGPTFYTLIALAIVAVIVLRTGNDPGIGVSGAETKFRALLEKILFVRPRTKDFLFGHPFLLYGLALAFLGNRKWLTVFLAAGAIGQADLLNTFCHIHTPIVYSLVRALLGLVIGVAIGAVVFLLAAPFLRPREPHSADRPGHSADLPGEPAPPRSYGVDV